MAELNLTDEFVVNRGDVSYTQEQQGLMAALQDTDYLLINRADQTYKITGTDLISSVIDPLEVTVILAPTDGYTSTEVTAVPVVSGGKQPDGGYIFTYQWVTADDAAGTNKVNIAGETGATFTPTAAQVGKYLGCVASTTDDLGTSAKGDGYVGPIQVLAQAPVISDVTVSEIYDGTNRYTDKEFPYVTTMAIDGAPSPTYGVKAKLSGTTFDFNVQSDVITAVDNTAGSYTCETDLIESVDGFTPSATEQGTAGNDLWNAFNGEIQTKDRAGCRAVDGNFVDYVLQVKGAKRVRLYVGAGGQGSGGQAVYSVNGTAYPTLTMRYGDQWTDWMDITGNVITSIRMECTATNSDTSQGIVLMAADVEDVNGQTYFLNLTDSEEFTLTLSGTKDLGCFAEGDVVQGHMYSLVGTATSPWPNTSVDNLFNGGDAPAVESDWFLNVQGEGEYLELSGINLPGSVLKISPGSGDAASNVSTAKVIINGTEVVPIGAAQAIFNLETWASPISAPLSFNIPGGVLKSFRLEQVTPGPNGAARGFGLPAIYVDNVMLVDEPEVHIIDIPDPQTDPPTITVDGGDWYAPGDVPADQNQDQVWSAAANYTGNVVSPTVAFNGLADGNAYPATNSSGGVVTWRPPNPVPFNTIKIVGWSNSDSLGLHINDTLVLGVEGSNVSPVTLDNADLVAKGITSPLTNISFNQNSTQGSGLYAVYLDDKLLVDATGDTTVKGKTTSWDTTLELAGATDLDVLQVGDVVKMGMDADVPYQPVSDSIVSVDEVLTVTYRYVTPVAEDCRTLNWSDGEGENTVNIGQSPAAGAGVFQTLWKLDSPATTTYLNTGATSASFNLFKSETGQGDWIYDSSGVSNSSLGPVKSSGTSIYWMAIRVGANSNETNVYPDRVKADEGMSRSGYYVTANGNITLTLSGPKDLAYFRPGDVVQNSTNATGNPAWNETRMWSEIIEVVTISPTSDIKNLFDGSLESGIGGTNTQAGSVFQIIIPADIPGTTISAQTAKPVNQMNFSLDGVNYVNKGETIPLPEGERTLYIKGMGPSTATCGAIYIDDLILVDPISVTSVEIVSTDLSAKTITVDGGEWSGWNQDQTWSSAPYFVDNGLADYSAGLGGGAREYIFNGQYPTNEDDCNLPVAGAGHYHSMQFGALFSTAKSVKIVGISGGTDAQRLKINGVDVSPASNVGVINEYTFDVSGTGLQSIDWGYFRTGNYFYMGAIYVDGSLLVDQGIDPGDTKVTCISPLKAPTDWKVERIHEDTNKLDLSHATPNDNAQVWVANDNQAGTNFYVEPTNAIPIEQDFAYGKLQIINNKAQVTGIQKADPDFLPVPAKDYSIQFPALFSTGNTPDDDLPRGVCIAAIVAAENSEGSSEKESNCFMPIDMNPDGAAGPITATTPTTLTVATATNLSEFSPGDNLVMVDDNNDISDYTIVSDSIETVTTNQGFAYDYYVIPGASGTTLAQTLGEIPSITTAQFEETIDFGNVPTSNTQAWYSFYELTKPGIISVIRLGGNVSKEANLAWSDDGTTWIDAIFLQPGGIGPDKPITGTSAHKYWCFWFLDTNHRGDLYMPDNTYITVDLALSGPTDLAYFRPGDVVQVFDVTISTNDGVFATDRGADKGFDGNGATLCASENLGISPVGTHWIEVNFNSGVDVESEINLNFWTSDHRNQVSINGGAYQSIAASPYVSIPFTGKLYSVRFSSTSDIRNGGAFTGIGYDGTILTADNVSTQQNNPVNVDIFSFKIIDIDDSVPSITVDGGDWYADPANGGDGSGDATSDTEVTYGPVTGTGVFQSADLNANTMTLSVSNDRWIDNNNRLSKNFYVRDNITVLNADNPKHVAMQQVIADAFTAFPQKVNERRTAIASSFYRLMGGETLSASEFELLEETVTNAVNATEPFALDGYYPLYYTSAKADAASEANSHHTHTIDGIEYYMPDGGTLYHGTYTS